MLTEIYLVEVFDRANFCQIAERCAFAYKESAEDWGFGLMTKRNKEDAELAGWDYRILPIPFMD